MARRRLAFLDDQNLPAAAVKAMIFSASRITFRLNLVPEVLPGRRHSCEPVAHLVQKPGFLEGPSLPGTNSALFHDFLINNPHEHECSNSCHRCLRDYGNMAYHPLLDSRLALDMVRLALDPVAAIDLTQPYWSTLVERTAPAYFQGLNYSATTLAGLPAGFDAGAGEVLILIHPLWDRDQANFRPEVASAVARAEACGWRWKLVPSSTLCAFRMSREAAMIVPLAPAIRELDRTSPTTYEAILKCIARAAWLVSATTSFCHLIPGALLGTALHFVLERARSGDVKANSEDQRLLEAGLLFDEKMKELFMEAHPMLRAKFDNQQLLPFYNLYRARAAQMAAEFVRCQVDKQLLEGPGRVLLRTPKLKSRLQAETEKLSAVLTCLIRRTRPSSIPRLAELAVRQ